jgi:hypothetical protein
VSARHVLPVLVTGLAAVWLLPSQSGPKIVFENIVERSGITCGMHNSVTRRKHRLETMQACVAVFDYNQEGLPEMQRSGQVHTVSEQGALPLARLATAPALGPSTPKRQD